jgi:FKBP-type peptidyl-prolyl cis-trans isomerase (trigger factor)
MKWEQHENKDGYSRLQVEADWSEVAADYDDVVSRHARIRLPGFRAGKIPRGVIEQRFHSEISAELAQRAAQRFGLQAVREAEIKVLGALEAQEVECVKGRPFRVMLRFWPMPQIDLPDLGTLGGAETGADPRDHISLKLLELVSFELPDKLIQAELGQRNTDEREPGIAGWQAASDRLRLMLILKQIAHQEGISVDAADLQDRIAVKAVEFETTKKTLQAELEKSGGMERLKDMLLAESILEYLMEKNRQERT